MRILKAQFKNEPYPYNLNKEMFALLITCSNVERENIFVNFSLLEAEQLFFNAKQFCREVGYDSNQVFLGMLEGTSSMWINDEFEPFLNSKFMKEEVNWVTKREENNESYIRYTTTNGGCSIKISDNKFPIVSIPKHFFRESSVEEMLVVIQGLINDLDRFYSKYETGSNIKDYKLLYDKDQNYYMVIPDYDVPPRELT